MSPSSGRSSRSSERSSSTRTTTKETTLEWYLNFIWLGDRCRGVGAAAMNYFGKPVQELTLAECASLDLHHQ
ncbi:MAG: transglycosylase domain-containing protein [Lawsonibacter sp.]